MPAKACAKGLPACRSRGSTNTATSRKAGTRLTLRRSLLVLGQGRPKPNDVEVIGVMRNDFALERCPADARVLFDHARANDELGASVFWVRPAMLLSEPLERFLAHGERKRDGGRRGIVEIRA